MTYAKLRNIKKPYFGYEEIGRILGVTPDSARVSAARFIQNDLIVRVKRNLYVLRDKWDGMAEEEKFVLANLAQSPSYISLMTAMSYYEVTTQIQRNFVESISIYRTKEIEVNGTVFNYSKINRNLYFGFLREKEFFIATPEKAFLDALYLMSLKRYSFDLSSIDFEKLNIAAIKRIIKKFPTKTQKLWNTYGYPKKT